MNPGTRVPEVAAPKFLNGFADGRDLFLLYRDVAGQRMARRVPAEWSSFVRKAEVPADLLRELKKSEFVAGVREEGEFLRICWAAEEWRRKAHGREGYFRELGIETFEADVSPVRRYFSETGAVVGSPRRVYLDIETDSRVPPAVARQGKARVLCWSLAVMGEGLRDPKLPHSRGRTVARGMLRHETDEDERRLLEELWTALEPYDQVASWFGDLFDFPVVKTRSLKVATRSKDPRRWLLIDYAEVWERMNSVAAESGAEKSSRALDFVAHETLGRGKKPFDARKTYEAWAAGGAERQRLADYCDEDTVLMPDMEDATGYLALNDSVCEVCRVFADTDSVVPTTFVDGFMLRMGVERGLRFADKRHDVGFEERKKFAGAWVLEPQVTGIRRNVHVVDFSGMYPSIIQTWNMSPDTVAEDVMVNGPLPPDRCRAPATGVGFRTDVPGLLSFAVAEMKRLRKVWQKRQAAAPPGSVEWWEAARRSAAYKRIVNIFYGIAGSPHSRYSDVRVAESVSTSGVWLIQKTIHAGDQRGLWAVYSDTDSSFFECRPGAEPLTHARLTEFVEHCNRDVYPAAVRAQGCVENHIDLAYEKVFERLVLISKKRYIAVYSSYKGTATCSCDVAREGGKSEPGSVDVKSMTCRDCGRVWESLPPARGKPEIRGLEYRRGDVLGLARKLQEDVINLLMRERCEDPQAFVPLVEAMKRHVLDEPLHVDEVSLAQSLTKSLKEYEKARRPLKDGKLSVEPAHVQVARILRSRGEQVVEGMRVPYVVVDGDVSPMKVIPAVDYAGECDRFYIWEDKVYPATQRVLEAAFPVAPGMTAEELRARDWAHYAKARPKKERGRAVVDAPARNPGSEGPTARERRAESAGQVGLFAAPVAAVVKAPDGPYVVELSEEHAGRIVAVKEALRAHPGDRAVELRLLVNGSVATLESSLRVAVSPELQRAVEVAKAGAA